MIFIHAKFRDVQGQSVYNEVHNDSKVGLLVPSFID